MQPNLLIHRQCNRPLVIVMVGLAVWNYDVRALCSVIILLQKRTPFSVVLPLAYGRHRRCTQVEGGEDRVALSCTGMKRGDCAFAKHYTQSCARAPTFSPH